jgi:multiple sugar transport system substrate-binding protein
MSDTLRIALVGGPMYDQLYARLAEFESGTGLRVEVAARLDHPMLNARLAAEFGAGGEPWYDLISTHTKYAPSQRNFLLPLDPYLEAGELADFPEALLDQARFEGELLGLPRNIDVKLLYYRTDLLDQAGLGVPQTWDALAAGARRLTRPPTCHGFVFPGRHSGLFGHFFELSTMAGGEPFGDDGGFSFNDGAGRWALGLLRDLYRDGAAPRDLVDWHFDEVTDFFLAGRAAMTTDWPSGYHRFKTAPAVANRFEVALYPVGPSGERHVYSGSHTFALPRSVRNRDGALALLRFLTSPESQYVEAACGGIPARRSMRDRIASEAIAGSRDARRLELLDVTMEKHMLFPPKLREYPAVEDALWTALRAAIAGEIGIEDALAQAEQRAAAIVR